MRHLLLSLAVIVNAVIVGNQRRAAAADGPPTADAVRGLLGGKEGIEEREELIKMGVAAFPAYEEILADPTSRGPSVARLFYILGQIKQDRRRFLPHAVKRLADQHPAVRGSAVELLGQIGTTGDASPVVALLSDAHAPVVHAAAKTLAAIGGEREVVAMDIWLLGPTRRDDGDLRRHVTQCRDQLRKRLDEARRKDKKE